MADKRDEGRYWLARANNALSASEALVSEELFDDAISRAYYAMFYATKALLIRDGVAAGSKHSAVVAAFGREYAKTGKIEPRYHQMLIEDFEWRQKADYDVFWHADRDTARGRVADAREFVSKISKIFI
ncbi:MAG: HEPN domain-containing protein [Acidobacteria bacterium]|nr:HEPN domain-containing protein [Acidobacteriota bacterium]